jgi:hypothetical protein
MPTTVSVKGKVTAQYIQNWLLIDLPGSMGQANIGMAKSDYISDQNLCILIDASTYGYECSRKEKHCDLGMISESFT